MYLLETDIYLSITDIVEAINTLFQERPNHSENSILDNVCRRTQKNEIQLANEGSGLAFCSSDLGNIFESNVGNEHGVMLRGKSSHQSLTNFLKTISACTLSSYTQT